MRTVVKRWDQLLISFTLAIFIFLEFYSISIGSHYRWDFFFVIGVLLITYLIRFRIHLHMFHFFLICLFMVVHNFGVFGLYGTKIYGVEFDFLMHMSGGFISSLVVYRYYKFVNFSKRYGKLRMYLLVMVIVLGISSIHEIVEIVGGSLLGEGEGVFYRGPGDMDPWDTQKDLWNNFVGIVLGIISYVIYEKEFPEKKKSKKRRRK